MTKEEKLQQCASKLAELLAEYGCDLVATPKIVDGRIVAIIQLVSKD